SRGARLKIGMMAVYSIMRGNAFDTSDHCGASLSGLAARFNFKPMSEDFARFFKPGRVHRQIYTDPAIFDLEMERIFGTAWIYVGHESQVKNPGDYFATRIGRRLVVMVRDEQGRVRVIHNQCAHRGAMVVATEAGNAAEFTCC